MPDVHLGPVQTGPPNAAIPPKVSHALEPLAHAMSTRTRTVHKGIATPEAQPYWQYLEKQNRRHDIRPDLTLRPPAADDGVASYRPRPCPCKPAAASGPQADRPAYAMPRIGEVPASKQVEHELRVDVMRVRQHLSARGRLVDAMA